MFIKTRFTRFVGAAAAAVCLVSGLNFTPFTIEIDAAGPMTAFEITENMQLGWNLGNTFDAYMSDDDDNILESCGLESETCWGNPRTTNEMLDAVKAKGFNTIRIPVTWFQHVDKNNNYKVDDAWMARVKEVVDYCYKKGFYIILNMHHEEGWANRPDLATAYNEIAPYFKSVWTQITANFAEYDQHLIFEAMNEPRAKGTDHEWWAPETPQAECDVINKLNADIVNIIRSTPSPYQDTRLIMLPSYCAGSDPAFMNGNKIPEGDPYLAASVHAYTPYNFTMNDEVEDHSQFTNGYKSDLKWCLDTVKKTFIDKNIPVVIGEFSSSNYGNLQARLDWAETYMTTTKSYGIPCVLWDNNVPSDNGGEAHGYLNRVDATWYSDSEPVIDRMLKVLKDPSISWGGGSGGASSNIEHEDISTGTKIYQGPADLDASKNTEATGYKNSVGVDIKWSQLEGKDVAVKFTGDDIAVAISDSKWNNWTEVNPYDVKDGIAYFSMEQLGEAWDGSLNDVAHFSIRTNGLTTVDSAYTIKAGEAPEDTAKKFKIDLSSRKDSDTKLVVTFTGAAGSAIEGCVGYMGAEWTNITFKDKIGSDGKFVFEVALGSGADAIPAGVTSAEAQIWWCDDAEGTMSGYQLTGNTVQQPTEAPTAAPTEAPTLPPTEVQAPTEAPTSSGVKPTLIGDANCDGRVSIADSTAILQSMANQGRYGLSPTGYANADCYNPGDGVSGLDALAIQKIDAGILAALPEIVNS